MITSRQNHQIKTIRSLRKCKETHAFLEGPNLIRECLASGLEPVELLATPEFLADPEHASLLANRSPGPLIVTRAVLASLVDAASPKGILAVVELPRGRAQALPRVDGGIYLALDAVQDPGNLGAIVRSAEATGAAGVALGPGCAHPNHPKALRASAGSLLRVPIAVETSASELVERLAGTDPLLVAMDPAGGQDLYRTQLDGTLVIALGSEGAGLSGSIRERAEILLTIPSAPEVESLNVTVAASVVLHELARRRRDRTCHATRPVADS